MRHKSILITLMLIMCGMLLAQTPQISISCSPSEIFVNNLSTGAFDPVNPYNQPVMTNIRVQNMIDQPFLYKINLVVKWNDIEIVNSINFNSKEQLHPGTSHNFTNRDFITQNEGPILEEPDGDISLSTIIDASPVLRDALQSGFFPDGVIVFEFNAMPQDVSITNPVNVSAAFTIRIKNITNIFLTFPGRPIGENPPLISASPVTFLWNSMGTQYNMFNLVINEFPSNTPPDIDLVETMGRKVFSGEIQGNIFSDYLPFENGHYYAWRVITGLIDENEPHIIQGKQKSSQSGTVESEWFVFRYSSDSGSSDSYYLQLLALLNMLNNPVIQDVFAQGYRITGAVFYEGQPFTGLDAVNLVKPLLDKDIDVEFTE